MAIEAGRVGVARKDVSETGRIKKELPTYGAAQAGKVLTVTDDGTLAWQTAGGAGGLALATNQILVTSAFFDSEGLLVENSTYRGYFFKIPTGATTLGLINFKSEAWTPSAAYLAQTDGYEKNVSVRKGALNRITSIDVGNSMYFSVESGATHFAVFGYSASGLANTYFYYK